MTGGKIMKKIPNRFLKLRYIIIILSGLLFLMVFSLVRNQQNQAGFADREQSVISSRISKVGIPFIANEGQFDQNVKFYARTFGGTVFVTETGEIVYTLTNGGREKTIAGLAFKEHFVGYRGKGIIGEDRAITKVNCFKGNDRSEWRSSIPTYNLVDLGDIDDGINLKLRAHGNNVEKIFCVDPSANPADIRVRVTGVDDLNINDGGELVVTSPAGPVTFTRPVAYQELADGRKYVDVAYAVQEHDYGFLVGDYDPEIQLIIDPLLASTFLGGWCDEICYGPFIETDQTGNVYLSGFTCTPNFPTSLGAYQSNLAGGGLDCFISKFSNDLTTLLASTFLGGSGMETECSIALDEEGNIYVGGYTDSPDFPTTPGAYDEVHNGAYDIFVSKLSNDMTTLLASTYIGGSSNDGYESNRIDLVVADSGDLYFVGQSRSVDFPVTPGAYDTSYNGAGFIQSGDAVVVKMDANLTTLLASTYLGGSNDEVRVSIALDQNENVFVCTGTYSNFIPTDASAYDPDFNGGSDVFISRLSNDLTTQTASTYLGNVSEEIPHVIEIGEDGNVYIAGYTSSSSFPISPGAYNMIHSGREDGFVSKFDNNLTTLAASTFFGGNEDDRCQALVVHQNGDVYVTGKTLSPNFPIVPGTYDDDYNGGGVDLHGDIFVSRLDNALSTLQASTFLGGSNDEKSFGIALDDSGNVFVGGFTHSDDYPWTPGAYDSTFHTFNNLRDVIVAKFLLEPELSIDDHADVLNTVTLSQNYPNPFNPTTIVKYDLPKNTKVVLKIYNVSGQEIRTLVDEFQTSGSKSAVWDGRDGSGKIVNSGVYIYRIQVHDPDLSTSKKMLFLN